ncbi:MAG: helix-turn-helix transcriptional regulator [Candidatus Eisenbacteria bacterium]
MKEIVANRVKVERVAKGVTQEELARAVGVSRQSIISIERGRYVPSLLLALKLAAFFGCPTDALFRREEMTRDR